MRKLFPFSCLLFVCLLAISSGSAQSSGPLSADPLSTGTGPVQATSWSFQCLYDTTCGADGSHGGSGTWITTTSQPGTVRLWDAGTDWYELETGDGTYDWTSLDTWLDLIAEHQPLTAIYTLGSVPCWISSTSCSGTGWTGLWTPSPPSDLTTSGSPSFNKFVTALVEHCSPANHCVKDYIKVYEMWNEANLVKFWGGTQAQLYDMFKPVFPIIRAHVSGAKISTPPVCSGKASWMAGWMALENANGRLSDYYGFHVYIESLLPEQSFALVARMLKTKDEYGWTTTPWMNTETNFDNHTAAGTSSCTPGSTTCDVCDSIYTPSECGGMLVRWHVLQYAYQGGSGGAINVGWFNWPSITAINNYDTYYYTMMQWLTGATFTTSCTSSGTVYTCPLTESNGASALIVWDTSGDSVYTPATEYVDYKKFNNTYGGAKTTISAGKATTIGVVPVIFEAK